MYNHSVIARSDVAISRSTRGIITSSRKTGTRNDLSYYNRLGKSEIDILDLVLFSYAMSQTHIVLPLQVYQCLYLLES